MQQARGDASASLNTAASRLLTAFNHSREVDRAAGMRGREAHADEKGICTHAPMQVFVRGALITLHCICRCLLSRKDQRRGAGVTQ